MQGWWASGCCWSREPRISPRCGICPMCMLWRPQTGAMRALGTQTGGLRTSPGAKPRISPESVTVPGRAPSEAAHRREPCISPRCRICPMCTLWYPQTGAMRAFWTQTRGLRHSPDAKPRISPESGCIPPNRPPRTAHIAKMPHLPDVHALVSANRGNACFGIRKPGQCGLPPGPNRAYCPKATRFWGARRRKLRTAGNLSYRSLYNGT